MPTQKCYTEKELIKELKKFKPKWKKWFNFHRLWEQDSEIEKFIRHAVDGSTFRAFRGVKNPAIKFRIWAKKYLTDKRLEELRKIKSQTEYSEWLNDMRKHLQGHWKAKKKMDYGHAMKLSNLLVKQLCCSKREIPQKTFNEIIEFIEVPLDKYSLQAIANCKKYLPEDVKIKGTDAMGYIKNDKKKYKKIQDGIRMLINENKVKVPPIAFDLFVWNHAH